MFKRLSVIIFIFHLAIKAQNTPVNRNDFQMEISPTNERITVSYTHLTLPTICSV